jgi:hypothetical protein
LQLSEKRCNFQNNFQNNFQKNFQNNFQEGPGNFEEHVKLG